MTETVSDHLLCEDSNCSWPTLHRQTEEASSPKKSQMNVNLYSTAGQLPNCYNLKNIFNLKKKLNTNLRVFTTDLYQELSTIFLAKDKSCIEDSRILSDWNSPVVKLKSRSPAYLFILEKAVM